MTELIPEPARRGVPDLDDSLAAVTERANAVLHGLEEEVDRRALREALVRFLLAARDHLHKEQAHLGQGAPTPVWWRYFYLARVLEDLQKASFAEPVNRVLVERLMNQWASEQFAAYAGDVRAVEGPLPVLSSSPQRSR